MESALSPRDCAASTLQEPAHSEQSERGRGISDLGIGSFLKTDGHERGQLLLALVAAWPVKPRADCQALLWECAVLLDPAQAR